MKKIILIITILSSIIIISWGQSINSSQKDKAVESQIMEKKCSVVVEGLQFCTITPFVSVKPGGNVNIRVSLKNKTVEAISVINGSLTDFYNVTVIDQNGNKILTSLENLEKKVSEGTSSIEDFIKELPIKNYSHPPKVLLAPEEELKLEFNLSQVYDFKNQGKYQIKISRKMPKRNGDGNAELSFGTIEVEIK